MKDLMLDIETMGVNPNAVVIQLAAVWFDIQTGEVFDTFCVNIDEEDAVKEGFTVCESTKKWWGQQKPEILAGIRKDTVLVKDAITDFATFLKKGGEDYRIWSHATFDYPIVANYLRQYVGTRRFNYKNARDIRTLVDLSGLDQDGFSWVKKTHNALDDCLFQIEYCHDAYTSLYKRN